MTYNDIIKIADTYLLPQISELYELEGYKINEIEPHEGGRNVVYNCEKEGADAKIIRIVFLSDRNQKDLLGEVEYIRYLFEGGCSVSNIISSRKGNLVGKMLVDNNYQYREGVPITEYFYNCGKVLGKMHQLSKGYTPVHRRYSFLINTTPNISIN